MHHCSRIIYVLSFLAALVLFPLPTLGRDFVLVLDAGHGGKDSGAPGTYSKEKNINLNVALKVGELIRKNCPDVKLIYTRKTDVFVELDERAEIANRAKADLFISIHTNALEGGRQASGSETYSLGMARAKENLDVAKRENSVILYENNYQERYAGFNPNSSESYIIFDFMQDTQMKQSAELARAIQQEYAAAGRPNKGVHQAGFLVLRKTSMPSVLTELGFITTPQEEAYLNSAKGTEELAECIYKGFVKFRNTLQRSRSVVLSSADEKAAVMEREAQEEKAQSEEKTEQKREEPTPESLPQQEKKQTETEPVRQQQETKAEIHTANSRATNDGQQEKGTKDEIPVFKIQIYTSNRMLREDATQFKGLKPIGYYRDNNLYKYTYGNTTSYKEIIALKKSVTEKFPDCFVIAFRGDEKVSVQEALKKK